MKNYLFFLPILIFSLGCDAPRRTLAPGQVVGSIGDPYNSGAFNNGGNGGGGTSTGGTTGGGDTNTPTDPGFQTCDLSAKYHTIDIGHFGLCQSTANETVFRFRTSLAIQSERVCLIPTYKDAHGSSTFLGNPQCTTTEANKVVTGQLFKDRPGYTQYPINGVIVMRQPLTTEYFKCMQAYVTWPRSACPQGPNNPYCAHFFQLCPHGGGGVQGPCDNEAKNYMNQVCTSFKNTYSNSYVDIRTK